MTTVGKAHILVVDDASLVRLYYRDILQKAGFAVEEALNGLEALEKLLLEPADLEHFAFRPDRLESQNALATNALRLGTASTRTHFSLVIVDVNMPQMDGLSFLKALRSQDSSIASIPALVTSTESAPQDIAAARAAGANFYLAKPVAPETLLACAALLGGVPS